MVFKNNPYFLNIVRSSLFLSPPLLFNPLDPFSSFVYPHIARSSVPRRPSVSQFSLTPTIENNLLLLSYFVFIWLFLSNKFCWSKVLFSIPIFSLVANFYFVTCYNTEVHCAQSLNESLFSRK